MIFSKHKDNQTVTSGLNPKNILFSKQEINKMVYPLIGQQLLSISVGIIDSTMVSATGEAALSGVSLINVLHVLLLYMFSAFSAGGAIVLSLSLGTKDMKTSKSATNHLILLCFYVAVVVSALSIAFRYPLLNLVYGDTDPEVMRHAQDYFFYLAIGYPFLSVSNACYSIFRSLGNTKISLYNSILTNAVNIVGNAILIYGFKMGAAGAAIATTISWVVSAVSMMYLLKDKNNPLCIENLFKTKIDFKMIKNICAVGIPNGIENSMFQIGKVLTQSLIAVFPLAQIAANSVASSVVNLQYGIGSAIGSVMITVVGRCIGAGEKEQAKYYAGKLLKTMYIITFGVSVIFCVFSRQIADMYNLSGETSSITIEILIFHSISALIMWPSAFTLPNAFRAAKDVSYTMVVSVISMWVFRVFLSYVFGIYMGLGVMGVWYAMVCDWLFRAVIFVARYIRGTWLTKYNPQIQ